jgi:ABC-type multidrug transport system fused ATPase/permease subunit
VGSHKELMKQDGRYREMVRLQIQREPEHGS